MAKGIQTSAGTVYASNVDDLTGASGRYIGYTVSATTQTVTTWGPAKIEQTHTGAQTFLTGKDYFGNNLSLRYKEIPVGYADSLYIFCWINDRVPETSQNYVCVAYQWTDDPERAANNIKAGNVNILGEYLYTGTAEDAEDVLVDVGEWDQTPSTDTDDPTNEGPRGGEYADRGDFDETDLIGLGDLPNPEELAFDLGSFLTCYCVNQTNMGIVGRTIFMPDFWTALGQRFTGLSDPLACIVSAVLIPFESVGAGAAALFKMGGIQVYDGVGDQNPVSLPKIPTANRYRSFGLGALSLKEVWGTEKDYSNTSIQIYLPYVGMKELDPDIVINTTVNLYLYLDTWTGDILYMLHTSNSTAQSKYFKSEGVAYRWSGNCGVQLPCGRVDNSERLLKIASGIGGIAAGFAMAGPMGAASVAGTIVKTPEQEAAVEARMAAASSNYAMDSAKRGIQTVTAGYSPIIQSSTGVESNFGRMDLQYPYLVIKRGVPEYPNGWRAEMGGPRLQKFKGSQCTGYTLFREVHLEGLPYATKEETEELARELCTEGIIF